MRGTDYDSRNPYESKQKVCAGVPHAIFEKVCKKVWLGPRRTPKKYRRRFWECARKIKRILRAHKHVRQQGWPHKNGYTRMAEQNNGFLRLGKDGPNEPRVDRPVLVYSLCHLNVFVYRCCRRMCMLRADMYSMYTTRVPLAPCNVGHMEISAGPRVGPIGASWSSLGHMGVRMRSQAGAQMDRLGWRAHPL